jgi:hypothetical protein
LLLCGDQLLEEASMSGDFARPVYLVIKQDGEDLARLDHYDGPIPRVGEYIKVPEMGDYGDAAAPTGRFHELSVKLISYGILARPRKYRAALYVQRAQNYVEVHV